MIGFASQLRAIGWSNEQAAGRLGVARSTIQAWSKGTNARGNPVAPRPEIMARVDRILQAIIEADALSKP